MHCFVLIDIVTSYLQLPPLFLSVKIMTFYIIDSVGRNNKIIES